MSDNPKPVHLWEAKHPYYCAEANYYASTGTTTHSEYKTWADFLSEFGDADMDYNLVFRWDWTEQGEDEQPTFNGDPYYRNGKLLIFFMGQRKGLYFWSEVAVCRADEEAVKAWLLPRFGYLMALWSPLMPAGAA